MTPDKAIVTSDIPARLDRLPWGRFHALVVAALGVTWILDGLEVTLAGSLAGALKQSPVLHFSNADIGLAASTYLAGAVLGALFFGWLTDWLGRKKLFFITLTVYLIATAATATSWNLASFALFRFVTGAGIGGEYAAINSTIQELIPARVRGWSDLVINGSFWVGAAMGALGSLVLLDPAVINTEIGWRLAFLIGASLALAIFFMRLWIPESPRWLMTHGSAEEAERVIAGIEARFDGLPPPHDLPRVRLCARRSTPLSEVAHTLFQRHRQRTLVGLSLMASQAFFYNAIFFTYALVLTDFYHVPSDHIGWYLLPFAAGNFLGPVLIGRLFDTQGRRPMIAFTYIVSGICLRCRLPVHARPDHGGNADAVLDGDLLFRFRCGELGLSHGERDLPAGNPRAGDRLLLRGRHRHRRHRRSLAIRRLDRHRLAHQRVRRLSRRRRAHDRRRAHRVEMGRRRRAQIARSGGEAADFHRYRLNRVAAAVQRQGWAALRPNNKARANDISVEPLVLRAQRKTRSLASSNVNFGNRPGRQNSFASALAL